MTVIDKTFETLDEGRAWLQRLDVAGTARVRIVISGEAVDSPETPDRDQTGEDVVDPARAFLEDIEHLAVDTGVEDLAHNHDHYLYGHSKKS